jgi:hypothetical protein
MKNGEEGRRKATAERARWFVFGPVKLRSLKLPTSRSEFAACFRTIHFFLASFKGVHNQAI